VNNHIFIFAVIGYMAGTFLAGCGESPEQKVNDAMENAGYAPQDPRNPQTEYDAKWRRFKRRSEQTIKTNENRIDAFKEKMEEAGPSFKARYRNEAAVLEQRNRSLKKKLGEYRDGGQVTSEEFRTNFNDDIDGVGRSMTALYKDDG
jgi:hypothetical protein